MSYTPIPKGTTNWDVPVNAELVSLDAATTSITAEAIKNFNNLSDLSSIPTARTNLGLGNSATRNVGTTTGTVAAGDDSRFSNASTFVLKNTLAHNVKDYGATGNGTTDDTSSINAAITAAKASTGSNIVFFPPGNYLISATLPVGGGFPGGLVIYGSGWQSTISLVNGANCYIFSLGNIYTPGLVIKDLFLSCNGANQTADSGGIDAYGAVSCLFENLQIDTPFYDGIYVHQDGTGSFGHHNLIRGCLFVNGKNSAGLGQALELFNADENYVVNCTFGDNGNPNNTYPLHNGAQPGGTVYQVFESAGLQHFIGNSFVNGGAGITMLRCNGSRNTLINNIFDGGSGQQLHVNGYANTIQNNLFVNIGSAASSGNPKAGLYLDGKNRSTISGNVFSPIPTGQGFAQAGIWTDFGADNHSILGNTFSLDGITATWVYGSIKLNSGGGHNFLVNNNGFNSSSVGTATITTGVNSIAVNHGMDITPVSVIVTPQSNPSPLTWWVSNITSSQFTINTSANPSSSLTFSWSAQTLLG